MTAQADAHTARLSELLERLARQPQIKDLWQLRAALLACKDAQTHANPAIQHSLDAVREFSGYLYQLQAKLSARQYSEWASRLDMGAVGALAIQDLLVEGEKTLKSYLLGGLSEALIILTSRQYIKAWDQEMRTTHHQAAWFLYEMLWQLSYQAQPDLPSEQRQTLIDQLISPAIDENAPPPLKAALLTRLFQAVLIILTAPLCANP